MKKLSLSDFFAIITTLTSEFQLHFDGTEYRLTVSHPVGDYFYNSNIELDIVNGFCSIQIFDKSTKRFASPTDVNEIIKLLK